MGDAFMRLPAYQARIRFRWPRYRNHLVFVLLSLQLSNKYMSSSLGTIHL
jgi:hypothetical protein